MTSAMNIEAGQLVKLVNPADAREAVAQYKVVELRGERVLIELVCNLPIRPTEAVLLSDVEIA